ncbi:hypothetical protein [Streptomyces albireticuli]|uniref:hypothetical protein n=1 Tax=Streptomyces albireticuli TaxID=1940 RepID=UPI0014746F86|nr:hypothetical protein [Streptomyces albireticuli]MCD9145794.1 hypothetical protein [Streptomyces albireticuli]MCD9165871.1 hypothetical protein [Streptomyces albireticuli]MCD9194450.1 hypothetical protein [Streptomyces albireticuli]
MTPSQATRLAMDRETLREARAADLAAMEPVALVLLVERLRGALDDAVRLGDELTE